jgi:hypothetical protein
MNRTAAIYALVSAALFGVSTPAAKLLIGSVDPIVLAGVLYCGAGIGVAMLRRLGPAILDAAAQQQSLSRQDNPVAGRGDCGWRSGRPACPIV